MARQRQRYRILTGLNYPTSPSLVRHLSAGGAWPESAVLARAVPGDVVDDLPAVSIPWLLAAGAIEPVTEEGANDAPPQ